MKHRIQGRMAAVLALGAGAAFGQARGQVGPQEGATLVNAPRLSTWVADGSDKVLQEELRAHLDPAGVRSTVWDGRRVSLAAARNEVVSFQVILEAPSTRVRDVHVQLESLVGPAGARIAAQPHDPSDAFDFRGRDIELFFVRYLEIEGLSRLSYDTYDERHVPELLRRPHDANGVAVANTDWTDRPTANLHYPDIAVPYDGTQSFDVAQGCSQSIWVDVYVPRDAAAGTFIGHVKVSARHAPTRALRVELEVRDFALPDEPTAKTMVFLGYGDINRRHLGIPWPNDGTAEAAASRRIRDNYFKVARRHRIDLADGNDGPEVWIGVDRPRDHWLAKLTGSFYTPANGYAGPGEGVGHDLFLVGFYGSWAWRGQGENAMHQRTDAWMQWFASNAPETEVGLYLVDEPNLDDPAQLAELQTWIAQMDSNPGIGATMKSFTTVAMPDARALLPGLDIVASWAGVGDPDEWDPALEHFQQPGRSAFLYNARRPNVGSFATEDDGVALQALSWAQYKRGIDRWFFWESTYWFNFQGCATANCQTNVFQQAQTFGGTNVQFDAVLGQTSWNHSNGDGVLFYPGTDLLYPQDSYGLDGPIVSLRLKHWRRGLQDAEYLALAASAAPQATQAIVDQMVPEVLWEYGIDDPNDPTYVRTDISWSRDPDDWEAARRTLAGLIEGSRPR